MTQIKSYTDIEQSKRLTEILPIGSADMYYQYVLPKSDKIKLNPEMGNPVNAVNWYNKGYTTYGKESVTLDEYCIPCWSLDALLETMPQSITKYIESERCQKTFHLNLFRSYYHCCSYSFVSSVSDDEGNNTLYCIGRDNWIDACYEMIVKLNELKLL